MWYAETMQRDRIPTAEESIARRDALLRAAGLEEKFAKVSKDWQQASERYRKLQAVGDPSEAEEDAYHAAFDAYYKVLAEAGVWSN